MSEFTYQPPNENIYHKAVLLALARAGQTTLRDALARAKCTVNTTGTYSRSRWNAVWTSVIFQIPMKEYESTIIGDDEKRILIGICDKVMPPDAGLDVMDVSITPLLESEENRTLEQDLGQVSASLRLVGAEFTLPTDILDKGKEMAEAYLYLYVVENYLRLFIEKVAQNRFGAEFFGSLKLSTNVQKGIEVRKKEEAKNAWISIRGGSELFYLDFKDLGDIILNNWELFKPYFPDQSWINSKISELGDCRNLVAHNSFIDKHERDVIRVNFNSIVRQLNPHMK